MKKIDWLRFLPMYWIQNNPTNFDWDDKLNDLLDKNTVLISRTGYSANIGGVEVWIKNYPYAYGSPYGRWEMDVLPSISTRKRLRKAVKKAKEKKLEKLISEITGGKA